MIANAWDPDEDPDAEAVTAAPAGSSTASGSRFSTPGASAATAATRRPFVEGLARLGRARARSRAARLELAVAGPLQPTTSGRCSSAPISRPIEVTLLGSARARARRWRCSAHADALLLLAQPARSQLVNFKLFEYLAAGGRSSRSRRAPRPAGSPPTPASRRSSRADDPEAIATALGRPARRRPARPRGAAAPLSATRRRPRRWRPCSRPRVAPIRRRRIGFRPVSEETSTASPPSTTRSLAPQVVGHYLAKASSSAAAEAPAVHAPAPRRRLAATGVLGRPARSADGSQSTWRRLPHPGDDGIDGRAGLPRSNAVRAPRQTIAFRGRRLTSSSPLPRITTSPLPMTCAPRLGDVARSPAGPVGRIVVGTTTPAISVLEAADGHRVPQARRAASTCPPSRAGPRLVWRSGGTPHPVSVGSSSGSLPDVVRCPSSRALGAAEGRCDRLAERLPGLRLADHAPVRRLVVSHAERRRSRLEPHRRVLHGRRPACSRRGDSASHQRPAMPRASSAIVLVGDRSDPPPVDRRGEMDVVRVRPRSGEWVVDVSGPIGQAALEWPLDEPPQDRVDPPVALRPSARHVLTEKARVIRPPQQPLEIPRTLSDPRPSLAGRSKTTTSARPERVSRT